MLSELEAYLDQAGAGCVEEAHAQERITAAQLPLHPVFDCDMNAGIVLIALTLNARDQHSRDAHGNYPFPGGQNAAEITAFVSEAAARIPGLDVSPLLAVLGDQERPGEYRRDFHLHEGAESIAQLAFHPGHVIIDQSAAEIATMTQALAAMHLAVFGTLPLRRGSDVAGCERCNRYACREHDDLNCTSCKRSSSRTYTAEVLASAHREGVLSPAFHAPSDLEYAVRFAERPSSPWIGLRPGWVLKIALAAREMLADLDDSEIERYLVSHPHLASRVAASGVLDGRPAALPSDVCATVP